MPSPNVTQNTAIATATTSDTVLSLSGVAAGATLVVLILQQGTTSRTFTVSDDVNGTWTQAASSGTGRSVHVWYRENSASGSINITVDQSGTLVTYTCVAAEVETCTFTAGSFSSESVNTTTHHSAASGSLDATANAIIFSAVQLNSSGGTITKTTGATEVGTTTATTIVQYLRSDSGFVDQRSTVTCTTARLSAGASAAFEAVGGGGSYTLTADLGSFSLSGQGAATLAGRIVQGDASVFTWLGQDASLRVSRVVTGDAASFSLAGQDAGLRVSRRVTSDTGAFALTGQDAGLTYTPVGGFAVSGEAGSFTFTGQAAGLRATRLLAGDTASFVLAGQDANLTQSAAGVEVDANAFAITDLTTTWAW